MPCYHPQTVYRVKEGRSSRGSWPITWDKSKGITDPSMTMQIPCQRCIGCRADKAREWGMRCMHESTLHEYNSFITLTYDDEHLPDNGSLNKEHFVLFMKRLRKRILKDYGVKIRFFHGAEYGEKFRRPHHHVIIFGCDFRKDRTRIFDSKTGFPQWNSAMLDSVWGMGRTTIGKCTAETCEYTAGYCIKKISGDLAETHYKDIVAEYGTMSRRPGIGKGWYDAYRSDIVGNGGLIIVKPGVQSGMPRYYKSKWEEEDFDEYHNISGKVKELAKKMSAENTPERLRQKEEVAKYRYAKYLYNRSLESDYKYVFDS